MTRRVVLALAAAVAVMASAPAARAADPLEPYRALARSPEGARLLSIAREAMGGESGDAYDLDWPGPPVAVYLTLARDDRTRACVGIPAPGHGTLAETVRRLAADALTADRRRVPVRSDELPELRVVLAFADEGEPIASPQRVDPGREGLLVGSDRGSVAFLPGEARTVSWALGEARRAGVLAAGAGNIHYRRFQVVVLAEPLAKSRARP